jgi:hypothetical protein
MGCHPDVIVFPLTNSSHFSRWLLHHQPVIGWCEKWWKTLKNMGFDRIWLVISWGFFFATNSVISWDVLGISLVFNHQSFFMFFQSINSRTVGISHGFNSCESWWSWWSWWMQVKCWREHILGAPYDRWPPLHWSFHGEANDDLRWLEMIGGTIGREAGNSWGTHQFPINHPF